MNTENRRTNEITDIGVIVKSLEDSDPVAIETCVLVHRHFDEKFFKSIRDGNINMIDIMLDKGFDINCSYNGRTEIGIFDEDDDTPLIIAIKYGHADCVAHLLKRGADVNKANDYGLTPVIAVSHGHEASRLDISTRLKIAEIILEYDPDLSARYEHDDNKRNAIEFAECYEFTELVQLLSTHLEREMLDYVYNAVKCGRYELIKPKHDEYLNRALFSSIHVNDFEKIEELLKQGADIDGHYLYKSDEQINLYCGDTPLIFAITQRYNVDGNDNKKMDSIRFLLKHGADVNKKDVRDRSALSYLTGDSSENIEIAKLLLEYNPDFIDEAIDHINSVSKDKRNHGFPLKFVEQTIELLACYKETKALMGNVSSITDDDHAVTLDF